MREDLVQACVEALRRRTEIGDSDPPDWGAPNPFARYDAAREEASRRLALLTPEEQAEALARFSRWFRSYLASDA
ncbi:protein of unknown function [Candidatus Hydrogenisulfobacillus filiaventi]|uniref:Uncharacterized protein n=1 Tax=Candidatus Hydrogenisulfobacillus filiaventi TaxID=2707344 RepID=A0A6F8ZHJ2_9FIRM|nr:protein of unknown function [Candidatus Hydrogenisulfobacillus filiaventi]